MHIPGSPFLREEIQPALLYFDADAELAKSEYLIDKLLPTGYLAFLACDPNQMKPTMHLAMAFAVASGTDFGGLKTQEAPVLWLNLASNEAEMHDTLCELPETIKRNFYRDSGKFLYISNTTASLDRQHGIDTLQRVVSNCGIKLVVVDSLHAVSSGRSLYDGWAAHRTLSGFHQLCSQTDVTVLILHYVRHVRYGQRLAESPQLAALAGLVMTLDSEADGETTRHTIRCTGPTPSSHRIWHFTSTNPFVFHPVLDEQPTVVVTRNASLATLILDALEKGPASPAELLDCARGASIGSIRNTIRSLREKGQVQLHSVSNRVRKYELCRKTA